MNLKCKIISNIKIFNFFIIHVAINFSEKSYKKLWINFFFFKWTHCGLLTLCLSHIENEKCGLKKYVIVISEKKKKKKATIK
jgi:hypothetical protein